MIKNPTSSRGLYVVRYHTGEYLVNNPAATPQTVRYWTIRSVAQSWVHEYANHKAEVFEITTHEHHEINMELEREGL